MEDTIPVKPKKSINRKPTINQRRVFDKVKEQLENTGKVSVSKAIRDAGLPAVTQKNPQQITRSKGWEELMKEHIPESLAIETHKSLMKATHLDQMTFPALKKPKKPKVNLNKDEEDDYEEIIEDDTEQITDEEIKIMLAEVNCTVKKIIHGQDFRYVYFWSADNRARKDGLDIYMKIKGKYKLPPGEGSKVEIKQIIIMNPNGGTDSYNTTYEETIRSVSSIKE